MTTTSAMFATGAHQAAATDTYPGHKSPDDWTCWTAENNSHEEVPDWIPKQVFIPSDSYSVIEGPTDFSMAALGGAGLNSYDGQAIAFGDHPGQFLDFSWQFESLRDFSVSPILHHVSDARGKFEFTGTPHPNLQPERHNINSGRAAPSMSSGQSSLYQALLSLEYTSDESTTHSTTTHHSSTSSPVPTQPCPDKSDFAKPVDREDDPDGIVTILCGVLSLDSEVESNSLPFVLQCYANWMNKMMFDPSRMSSKVKNYIVRRYVGPTQSRFRMILTANILRVAVIPNTNYKPMLSILANDIRQTLVQSRDPSVPVAWDSDTSLLSPLHFTLELNLFYLYGPLHGAFQTLGDIAPVIRRMCSEPSSQYIHLPSLLAHPDSNVRGYPTIDILYSMLTGLPTHLKYDATLRLNPHGPHYTEPLGAWLIGQPGELTLILARVSSLHDEFGLDVDPDIIEEIESDIQAFRPDPGASANPSLTVTRLVVLEAWRQVGYINLYMRLCGESSLGPRVQTAHRRLIELIANTKPGFKVDSHLGPCIGIAGLAANQTDERNLVLARLESLPYSREDSFLNRALQMLRDIWIRTDSEGRPAQWSDLRIATRRIIGI